MILNNVTILRNNELVRTDVYFNDRIMLIKNNLDKGRDCSGLFLMPGLINAHAHLSSRMVKGSAIGLSKYDYFNNYWFDFKKKRKDSDVFNASLLACLEFISNGITHVDFMDSSIKPAINGAVKSGINFTACIPLKDYDDDAMNVNEMLNLTLRLRKKYGNKVLLGLANEFECSPQLIRESSSFAKSNDLPIHMHACETLSEVNHFKKITGYRTIDYLDSIGLLDYDLRLAHCTYCDSKDVINLSNHYVSVIHCPSSNIAITGKTMPVKLMINNDVNIKLGTDSFAWNPSPSILSEAWRSHEITGISPLNAYLMTHEPLIEGSPASFSLVSMDKLRPFYSVNDFLIKLMNTNAITSVFINGKELLINDLLIMINKLRSKYDY